MSALLEKFSIGSGRKGGGLGAPAVPQVNLLPASVGDAKRDARLRKILAAGLVGVIVLAGLFYYVAVSTESSAEEELATENAKTVQLVKEKATLDYVPRVIAQHTNALMAQSLSMGHEVNWRDYIGAVTAVLPANTSVTSIVVTSDAIGAVLAPNANLLAAPRVATMTFVTRSATVPDTAVWLGALKAVPGFQDVTLATAALADEDGNVFYEVTSTVEMDETTHSGRLFPTVDTAAEGESN